VTAAISATEARPAGLRRRPRPASLRLGLNGAGGPKGREGRFTRPILGAAGYGAHWKELLVFAHPSS
jgi:hypothetical protein